jgi:hypothetical protein
VATKLALRLEQTSKLGFYLSNGSPAAVRARHQRHFAERSPMRRFFLTAAFLAGFSAQVSAGVVVHIDNSAQRMQVYVDGGLAYVWPVSTARRGYWTPPGNYYVQRMARMWYSRKYDMSPMPHSLFFHGGYAIHGTGAIRQLGRPASHGCVRLHPANARALYGLVASYGGARILVRT